ncbi:expressed unknown protein [Seminavis robusta]|uniref:Uncharacterized protein n=1 Tax=Seminavis robusta TaxID=568900 RepID=A0A9N8DEH1_9STRA|nr:expressed unknown protein [Seminavis robusta]|eukprot:Sro57_g033140.1 n/a (161) ;mRNA; f:17826-18308
MIKFVTTVALLFSVVDPVASFAGVAPCRVAAPSVGSNRKPCSFRSFRSVLRMSDNQTPTSSEEEKKQDDGVIELVDLEEVVADASETEETSPSLAAPFLSQGEIQEESLKVDLSDPKQTRVIIYIILSLLPVLFLIPLMLGSREFLPAIIPMDDLPPVQL